MTFFLTRTLYMNTVYCHYIAAVTLNQDLLTRVIPPDQSFDEDKYAGINTPFHGYGLAFYTFCMIYCQAYFTFAFGSMATGTMLLLMIGYHLLRPINLFIVKIKKTGMKCGLLSLKKRMQSKFKRNKSISFVALSLIFSEFVVHTKLWIWAIQRTLSLI